ncbi:MAG: hypothetical protein MHMPM18_000071 [Marteilia pararefringens]
MIFHLKRLKSRFQEQIERFQFTSAPQSSKSGDKEQSESAKQLLPSSLHAVAIKLRLNPFAKAHTRPDRQALWLIASNWRTLAPNRTELKGRHDERPCASIITTTTSHIACRCRTCLDDCVSINKQATCHIEQHFGLIWSTI